MSILIGSGEEFAGDGGLSAAKKAVQHALQRVVDNPDFRYLMLHTETLELLVQAQAELHGKTFDEVKNEWERAVVKSADRQGKPRVIELSERVDQLEARLELRRNKVVESEKQSQPYDPCAYLDAIHEQDLLERAKQLSSTSSP